MKCFTCRHFDGDMEGRTCRAFHMRHKKTCWEPKAHIRSCNNCFHYVSDGMGMCCSIQMGLDCYHNNDEPWKHWKSKTIVCPKFGVWDVECASKHSCETCEDTQFIKANEMAI